MTKREQIDARYKDVFGRKARKDYDDQRIIDLIEKETGEKMTFEEEVKEAPKEEAPKEAPQLKEETKETPKETKPKSPPVTAKDVKARDAVDELGNVLTQGREFLWYLDNAPRYNTKRVVELAIRQYGNRVTIPEGSPFQVVASDNKCKDC